MIPFNKPLLIGGERKYLEKVLANRRLSGDGEFTKKCNKWIEKKFHCKKALLTTSCSHALDMAAMLIDIQPGDEVIMPSYTFVSTANAFALRGAKIIFVDIRPDTMNIDENLIEKAITPKTKAIIPVHYAGVSCEMDKILALAKKYKLYVIEDAAQGVMSTYKGRYLGTLGDIGCYSFHETKNYTSGEGGAIILNKKKFIEKAEIIREKGTDRSKFNRGQVDKYSWVGLGSSYLPSELNAACLYAQLEKAEQINSRRRVIWRFYYKKLKKLRDAGCIELPYVPNGCIHNGHMFYIKVRNIEERTRLINHLLKNNILSVFHYVPLHSSRAGLKYGLFRGKDDFTTKESDCLIRLPLYYEIKRGEVEKVIANIHSFFGKHYPVRKNSYWKKSWLRDLCWFLGFMVLFFIVSRAFFSFLWTDDYCTLNVLQDKAIWQYAWYGYTQWDGRGIMTGLITGPALRYFPVELTNSLWALSLVGTAFFVNKILTLELPFLSRDKYDSLIRVAAIAGTLWLGMGIHISETIYWTTGGYYIFSTMLGTLWIYSLLKLFRRSDKSSFWGKYKTLVFFIVSIPVGMLSHNLSTGLLVFGAILIIIYWLSNNLRFRDLLTTVLASTGIMIGTIIISIAPGNFIRATAGRRSFQLSIPVLIQNLLDTVEFYIGISLSLVVLCILAAFLLTFLTGRRFGLKKVLLFGLSSLSQDIKIPLNKKTLIRLLDKIKYLIVSLATAIPFMLLPDFSTPRTSIYFMVFLTIFILASSIAIFKSILIIPENKTDISKRNSAKFAYFCLSLLFLSQMSVLITHNVQTYRIQKEILKRESLLKENSDKNKKIVVPPLKINVVPFSARFSDINEDPEFWINQCLSQYYGFESIRVDSKNK